VSALLLYGASGYTGKLILASARGQLDVTAAGRNPRADAREEHVVLALDDAAALRRVLAEHPVVLNCAGPFAETWEPIVDACLETGTHYLDITGEWQVFEALRARSDEARERGVMLLPGVGFDVVASDCLAAHVARRLPDASRLQIGISALELVSRGSARTIMRAAGEKVRVRRDGRLVPEARLLEAVFDFGRGAQSAHAVSWGDLSTAFHTTGIPNIEVYFEATPLVVGLDFANRTFGWLAGTPLVRTLTRRGLELLPPGPAPQVRATLSTTVVARAENGSGRCVESRLTTPEAYSFTATTAVAVAERVIAGSVRPGFQTPGSLFGPDFVLQLAGAERVDLCTQPAAPMAAV
jgi:short subunit dehydrogenase-like uncharacterized protein